MTPSLHGVRVLLADDHAMVRLGFRLLLEGAGATVVAEAASGEQALDLQGKVAADLVIMDVSMPGSGGLDALERLLGRDAGVRVLMVSAHQDDVVPHRTLRLGARGYLCKRAAPEEFLRAAAKVAAGQRYIDPELAQAVAFAEVSGASNPVQALSDKELQVFLQLARGRSVNAVAADFRVSTSTVGTHLYHIKQKLQVDNAAQLALAALRSGLIEP